MGNLAKTVPQCKKKKMNFFSEKAGDFCSTIPHKICRFWAALAPLYSQGTFFPFVKKKKTRKATIVAFRA